MFPAIDSVQTGIRLGADDYPTKPGTVLEALATPVGVPSARDSRGLDLRAARGMYIATSLLRKRAASE